MASTGDNGSCLADAGFLAYDLADADGACCWRERFLGIDGIGRHRVQRFPQPIWLVLLLAIVILSAR